MESRDNEPRKYGLTSREVEECVVNIDAQMKAASYHPLIILGIGRGGMIPAAMLGYQYGVRTGLYPDVATVYAWSYMQDGTCKVKGGIKIDWPPAPLVNNWKAMGENVLIVDDLTDTGETLGAFKDFFPRAKTAVLIHKEATATILPYFIGRRDNKGLWYVFPWEKRVQGNRN